MSTLLQDIRFAIHALLKRPGFSSVVILTFALGIGANTAVFSVIDTVIFRPLSFSEPDQLVVIRPTDEERTRRNDSVSYLNFADWQEQSSVFAHMGALTRAQFTVTGIGDPIAANGARVSGEFFQTLRTQAALGRALLPRDDLADSDKVVVISHDLWQRYFEGSPETLKRTVTINGVAHLIVGVLPDGFRSPVNVKKVDMWASTDRTWASDRGRQYLRVIARLKPDVTLDHAQVQMDTVARRLEEAYPKTNEGLGVRLVPLHEVVVGNVRPVLLTLFGAVGLVLLIACANVANLLLVRSAERKKELAVRTALGARRFRLVRQILTESVLLGLLGAILGVLLAAWSVDALIASVPGNYPRLNEVALDGRVLGFTLLITLLTSVMFGLGPALRASRSDLRASLQESGRRTSVTGHSRMRNSLVVCEVALALVLLTGAGLLIRSFERLVKVEPGFAHKDVLTFELRASSWDYDRAERAELYRQVLERLEGMSGTLGVAANTSLPWAGYTISRSFEIPGRSTTRSEDELEAAFSSISSGYFQTMSIPLLKGRAFNDLDGGGRSAVAIVNESLASRYFENQDPIGRHITFDGQAVVPSLMEIVGIVGDARVGSIDTPPEPRIYVPYQQDTWPMMCFALKCAGDPMQLAGAVRSEVAAVTADEAVSGLTTLDECLADTLGPRRFPLMLLTLFSTLALGLAALGIYSVLSYSVAQRTHEIGMRMAVGARETDVLRLVLGRGLKLIGIGLGLGLPIAFGLARVLASQLYEIGTGDPTTFIGVSMVLGVVALLACYIPARRATKVDPIVALRYE
ncbi:MAG: ABC transporter permease [Phycisphaerales bacterium]|nr:MAG: ABC transporter permease [Phycisphaerales bacterium]